MFILLNDILFVRHTRDPRLNASRYRHTC